jgi:hypothetical protein
MAYGDLTTLADVKTWLQTSQSAFPPTDDALLTRLIIAASQYIQTWLNRQIAQCDYIEVRDGTGGQRLQFARFPVCAVQSLTIDGIAIPPAPPPVPSTGLSAGYVFSPTQLAIRGYYFTRRVQNVVITYSAGYAATPPDIAQACIELVALRYRERTDRRDFEIGWSRRDGNLRAEGHEPTDCDATPAIPPGRTDHRLFGDYGTDQYRPGDRCGGPVISAELLGDGPALDRLRGLPSAVNEGLARAIAKLGIALQSSVRQDKLSGEVLKVRSGGLKSSIDVEIDKSGAGVTATVFSDLDYAAAQEYGFLGTVNVRASLRLIKQAFGHPIATKTVSVRAHSRQTDLPARSFLQSALDNMAPNISTDVEDALREAIT